MYTSLSVLTTGVSSGSAAWEIRTSANKRARLLELGLFLTAATASVYQLGRPAAIGVTPTSPVDFLPEDNADVEVSGDLQSALAWSTAPTSPANFFRGINLPAQIGTGVIWTFPKGIVIPYSSSLVLWNGAANGAVRAYALLDL